MNNAILADKKKSLEFDNNFKIHIQNEPLLILESRALWGWKMKIIKAGIWITILLVAIKTHKNLWEAIKKTKELIKMRNRYRNNKLLQKYFFVNNKYYFNYNAPGWPSAAFNRYIVHLFKNANPSNPSPSLHTLIFGITKKCGFKCEHCFEWEALNKPEQLTKEDLLFILNRFYKNGIAQVQLSGGEPLNRFDDILYLLNHSPVALNFWIYTSGFDLSYKKARLLKSNGLTGVTISLDHWDPLLHDRFRGKVGSFHRVLKAIRNAVQNKLIVTLSLCATRSFITKENLYRYAALAKDNNVTFIQILEPKAVGHYLGKDVLLQKIHTDILEDFHENMNYNKEYKSYPLVTYHGFNSRSVGCSGSGKDYLYVDTDGDVHNCPFCQHKIFSALSENIDDSIIKMKNAGCNAYNSCSFQNK